MQRWNYLELIKINIFQYQLLFLNMFHLSDFVEVRILGNAMHK